MAEFVRGLLVDIYYQRPAFSDKGAVNTQMCAMQRDDRAAGGLQRKGQSPERHLADVVPQRFHRPFPVIDVSELHHYRYPSHYRAASNAVHAVVGR